MPQTPGKSSAERDHSWGKIWLKIEEIAERKISCLDNVQRIDKKLSRNCYRGSLDIQSGF